MDGLTRKEGKLEWADVIRDLGNMVEMEVAIGGEDYVFRGQTSLRGRKSISCGVCHQNHAVCLPNLSCLKFSARWRESVSPTSFINCKVLIINHFLKYGVEDEPESGPSGQLLCS